MGYTLLMRAVQLLGILGCLALAACPPHDGNCQRSFDCPSSQVCLQERCRKTCETGDTCQDGERCLHGVCLPIPVNVDGGILDRDGANDHRLLDRGADETPVAQLDTVATDLRPVDIAPVDRAPADIAIGDSPSRDALDDLLPQDLGVTGDRTADHPPARDRPEADDGSCITGTDCASGFCYRQRCAQHPQDYACVNLARDAAATATGTHYFHAEAEHAVDGIELSGSAWVAHQPSPQSLTVDLGVIASVNRIIVNPCHHPTDPGPWYYTSDWNIQRSTNGVEWHDFTEVELRWGEGSLVGPGIAITGGDPGNVSDLGYQQYVLDFTQVGVKYVRFTVIHGDVDDDSNLDEIKICWAI